MDDNDVRSYDKTPDLINLTKIHLIIIFIMIISENYQYSL